LLAERRPGGSCPLYSQERRRRRRPWPAQTSIVGQRGAREPHRGRRDCRQREPAQFVNEIRFLKCHSQTPAGAPDHTAPLSGTAKQQFESTGQYDLPANLEARAAWRIIHNPAIDDRRFRTEDQFGRGTFARGPNTCEESRIHRCFSMTSAFSGAPFRFHRNGKGSGSPANNFAGCLEGFVDFRRYRNADWAVSNRSLFRIAKNCKFELSSLQSRASHVWARFPDVQNERRRISRTAPKTGLRRFCSTHRKAGKPVETTNVSPRPGYRRPQS
jgi:hypothetical protein